MFKHEDILAPLSSEAPLKEKLQHVHQAIHREMPFIARIAVALYDPRTALLKTYLHSSGEDDPLSNYQVNLDKAPSLKEILRHGRPRVVNNMVTFENGTQEHTKRLGRSGYAASYTRPMFYNGAFVGFLFFNSFERDVFTEHALHNLDVYGHLLSLLIINDLTAARILTAAVKTTRQISLSRDPETGSHLDRMSHYARIIAVALAEKYRYDDVFIERVYAFAPLHDIGKIAIPDKILLKPAPLDYDEIQIMKMHTVHGRDIVDDLLKNFELGHLDGVEILRNIAEFHHEAVDGSGYLAGLESDNIPLEARIVAVADVFDALTSRRAYKEAWSNEEAFSWLKQLAGEKFDCDCVDALIQNRALIEAIQQQFEDDYFG
ncbi:MAG: HD domain-containing phosphohydrolase [Gammaproteobacteria bacterium]